MTSIEVKQFLPQAPARVWQALTDPDLLAGWLMPNDFKPVIGHAFTFPTEPVPQHGFDGIVHGKVLDLEPPRLMRFSWRARGLNTVVSWSLTPKGTGTRLLTTHEGFDDTDRGQRMVMGILGGGWRGHLIRKLGTLLGVEGPEGTRPRLPPDPVLSHLQLPHDLGRGTRREASGGTSLVTTELAPTTEPSPIVTPGRITALRPSHTLSPMTVGPL